MRSFATSLFMHAGNVEVVDQTGLPGLYDLSFKTGPENPGPDSPVRADSPAGGRGGNGRRVCDPSFSRILEDHPGLMLRPAIVPTEYIVVDHSEKPTEK